MKYFSRQLSCKRKVALQERNAKLEGFPQLLHWFRIVDIRKEVMEVRAGRSRPEKEGFSQDFVGSPPSPPARTPRCCSQWVSHGSRCSGDVPRVPISVLLPRPGLLQVMGGTQRRSHLQGKGNSAAEVTVLHVPNQGWVFLVLPGVQLGPDIPKSVAKLEIKLKFLQVFLGDSGGKWMGLGP